MGRTISFTVETDQKRDDIEKYARSKGLKNASSFALFAITYYMTRYPYKPLTAVTACATEGHPEPMSEE